MLSTAFIETSLTPALPVYSLSRSMTGKSHDGVDGAHGAHILPPVRVQPLLGGALSKTLRGRTGCRGAELLFPVHTATVCHTGCRDRRRPECHGDMFGMLAVFVATRPSRTS